MSEADFTVQNHGSIVLVNPENETARTHLQENVSDEAMWYAGALVVEPRYVSNLVDGLRDNGYSVE